MGAVKKLLASSLLLCSSLCNAAPPQKRPIRRDETVESPGTPHAFNFTMPIDHFTKSDTRTYQNEYWVNDTFYQPGGPVFLFDLGETGSTAQDAAFTISWEPLVYSTLIERYHGLAIAWQHRFYGYSLPFPVDANGVPEGGVKAFQYLTQEQAMEDVVYFADNIADTQKKLNIPGDNVLHPDKTPWIFVGGSYPGMRAALLRVRNPDTIYASWASSAPLQPDADGSAYFNAALRSLYSNCTSDFHQLVKWSDSMYDNKNTTATRFIQERWWMANALATNQTNVLNATDAANMTAATIGRLFQSPLGLGDFMHQGPATVRLFCDFMETYDAAKAETKTSIERYDPDSSGNKLKARDSGLFSYYGPEATLDAFLAAYVWAQNPNFQNMPTETDGASDSTKSSSSSSNADEHAIIDVWGDVAWAWQTLYELGNFIGWSPDYERWHPTDSILSKYYTWELNRLETIALMPGIDPADVPEVTSYWAEYGGWGMQPGNTLFTDSLWDPWRAYSPGSWEYEMGKPVRNYTMDMPACGLPLEGTRLFGYFYEGDDSGHCSDIGPNSKWQASHSLGLFMHALDAWLPCFHADD